MSSSIYSNKLRVRACGLLLDQDKVLLVQILSPVSKKNIWTPPGGGVEPGESLKETVCREFLEETGLEVEAKRLVLINELIEAPFHALEFFFEVERISGELKLGEDPEHKEDEQLLKGLRFFSNEELETEEDVKPEFVKNVFKILKEDLPIQVNLRNENG